MSRGTIPPQYWPQRQHMGPQPGSGQLNPNANGTDVPYLPAAEFKPSQPQMGDPRRRIILPGADFPPADGIPVDEFGDATISPVPGFNTATLVTVVVPDTLTFRISGIGFGADDETSLRFMAWTIIATPPVAPILGYSQKPAGVGSILHLSHIFACVGSSVTVTVTATNNNPTSRYFICRLQGWFYSERGA